VTTTLDHWPPPFDVEEAMILAALSSEPQTLDVAADPVALLKMS
jgi:hypothetical protein